MSEKFTVGQELYYVPGDQRWYKPCNVQIEKVGRQYLTIKGRRNRVNIESMRDENYAGTYYLSKEDYETKQAVDEAWVKFTKRIDTHKWKAPDGIGLEQIEQAGKLLFGEVW